MEGSEQYRTIAFEAFDGSRSEFKRAQYILAFLQSGSVAFACKASGLSRMSHQRIVQMIAERGHAFDSSRSGRPVVYSAAIMEPACEKLINSDEGYLNGKQLQHKLVSEGVLHPSSDVDTFMRHLKQHVASQGHKLIVNSVKTTFYIKQSDKKHRMAYAQAVLDLLRTSKSLANLIYTDEVILEESPHPKGEHVTR